MTPASLNIFVHGYRGENNLDLFPNQSGIYFVFEATYLSDKKIIYINRLIYIGEAEKIRDRIINHEKWRDWKKYIRGGSQICFSYALVEPAHRKRIEAALIFKHKPPTNDEFRYSFPFDTTTIKLEGKISLLDSYFTVYELTSSF